MERQRVHTFDVRVYYEDTDFSGNVYHAAYAKFMERARSEFLRDSGVIHSEWRDKGLFFVVRRLEIIYRQPAHIDDVLVVRTSVGKTGGARMVLNQDIWRGDVKLTEGQVEVALVGADGRPQRMRGDFVARL